MWSLFLDQAPTFKWYRTRLAVKHGDQKDKCHNDIGLSIQNLDIILGSIVLTQLGGKVCNHLQRTKTFTLLLSHYFCISTPLLRLEMADLQLMTAGDDSGSIHQIRVRKCSQ